MKRLLPFVVLLVLLLGGAIAVPVFLNPERHRQEITSTVSALFKRPTAIGPLSMSYWPPTLTIGSLSVMKEEGNAGLQIESASLPLDGMSLLHLKFVPAALELNHWTLSIQRKADGTWDLRDWFSGIAAPSKGREMPLRQVRWTDGRIRWIDPYGAVPQELVLGSIEGHWNPAEAVLTSAGVFSGLSSTARMTVSARGQFFSSPQWTSDVQLTDQGNTCGFHLDDKAGLLEIKGDSDRWGLANTLAFLKFFGRAAADTTGSSTALTLDHWHVHLNGTSDHFSFDQKAELAGGTAEMQGHVATTPSGPLLHVDGIMKDVPVEGVKNLMGDMIPITGQVTGGVKDFELVLSSQTLSTLKGEGYWELQGGRYRLPEASMQKLAKARTLAYFKQKYPDMHDKGFPVLRLSAHWEAREGIVTIDDGFFAPSADVKASWAGKIDLVRRGLDGYIRLQMSEHDPALLNLIPPKYRTQPAFGRLQGTWLEWSLKAIRTAKIPAAVQSKLRKAVTQK